MSGSGPPEPLGEPPVDNPFATITVQRAWPTRRPGAGPAGSHQVRARRFPHERWALAVALVVVFGTIAAAYTFVSQQAAAIAVGTILAQFVAVRFQVRALVGRAAEVTPAQFASLHAIVRRGSEILDAPPTRVFVVQDPVPNAFSFGFSRPYGIVLTSALVEGLDEPEMTAVIGHELGHITLGHTRVSLLFGGVDVPLGIPFVQLLVRAPFLWWMRCAELSADRVAVAVCGRVSPIIAGLVKVAVGPRLYHQVRPDELARQAHEFYRGPWAVISQLQSSHPFLISRIQQIVDFAGPPEIGHGLRLARPDGLAVRLDQSPGPESERDHARVGGHAPETAPPGEVSTASSQRHPKSADLASAGPAPPASAESHGTSKRRPAAWLQVRRADGDLRRVPIEADWLTVGRGGENDVVLEDPRISYRHFGIRLEGSVYTLHDLNSRNGTRLNGEQLRQAPLNDGDEIQVGGTRVTFSLVG